jgi:hypothetical protein
VPRVALASRTAPNPGRHVRVTWAEKSTDVGDGIDWLTLTSFKLVLLLEQRM